MGDGSELLLALTNSDTKKAVSSAALARKGLQAVSQEYQQKVEALWERANTEAVEHLMVVLKNNPHKSKADIFRREDVRSALRWPYEQAAIESEALIREAWLRGELETVSKVKGEFKLAKAAWKGHEIDEGLLDALVGDIHANAQAMRSRYLAAVKTEDPQHALEVLTNDARTRASFSVSTAVWSVATQVRDSATRLAGLNKMWVARLDDKTCSHCRFLHGTVIGPGESFPLINVMGKVLKTYLNAPLMGPPRHPQCRCIVVGTKLKKSKTKS